MISIEKTVPRSVINQRAIYLIQGTSATIEGFKKSGFWNRQKKILGAYGERHIVFYYTADCYDYQSEMPRNVYHKKPCIASRRFPLKHLSFFIFLLFSSFEWKNGILRILGTNVPVLSMIKVISRLPVVMNFQYDWGTQTRMNYQGLKGTLAPMIQSMSIQSADYLVCSMTWLRQIVIKRYRQPSQKIYIIPNFIDLHSFKPGPKKKQVIYAGRLHWSKGVNYLIDAFKIFSSAHKDYNLIIIGEGEERIHLEKSANERIFFLGNRPQEEVAKFLSESAIFVLPTVTMEGHPKSLIEAMASKCICLASNVPGNRDVLTECGLTENLFERISSSAILKALLLAIDKDNSEQSYRFALDNYSFKRYIELERKILSIVM